MNYEALAWQIYLLTGPADNVNSVTHCMTRLRLGLKDLPPESVPKLKKLDGVLGVNNAEGELQIVIGPGKVDKVTDAFAALCQQSVSASSKSCVSSSAKDKISSNDNTDNAQPATNVGNAEALHARIRAKNATPVKLFFKRIASIFIPLIPAFIACGLISGILNVVGKAEPTLMSSPIFQLLAIGGNIIFWSMNLFIGFNTAKEFGGTPIIGGILGGLLSHPSLANVSFDGYTLVPGRGGVISVLLAASLGAYVEKQLRKVVPEMFSLFLTPLLTFLITGTIAIGIFQPVGGFLSDVIGQTATTAVNSGGAITGFILGGLWLPMVMLGIHQVFTPIHAELLARYGVTILLPILAMAGGGQVGASFAVYLKTKNHALKKTIASALPVGLMGVGEPLIYGVTLPLCKPFIGACIGGAFGGAVQAAFAVGSTTIGISGLPLAAGTDHIGIYLLGLLISYVAGFIATWLIGFDDPPEE